MYVCIIYIGNKSRNFDNLINLNLQDCIVLVLHTVVTFSLRLTNPTGALLKSPRRTIAQSAKPYSLLLDKP